jgi:uracil-DNA glycosylase
MKSKLIYKALAKRTELLSRSDFLNRDEAYRWLIASAQQGKWTEFEHILTDLMFDMRPFLFANYGFSDEEVMDYMMAEMENKELEEYIFPFGQRLNKVEQLDRTPKKIFVLGVYASAVHAKWIGVDGKHKVNALAVASEPYIFWRGDRTEDIIANIKIPKELGTLVPARDDLNGPSGNALDNFYLHPLGLNRIDAWLCDMVPHACLNPRQNAAIIREYIPLMEEFDLPKVTLPNAPKNFKNFRRVQQIIEEINLSQPKVIITLGNDPIDWFLKRFTGIGQLSQMGTTPDSYGRLHPCEIAGKSLYWLPLCHPRQAARLGGFNDSWYQLHQSWLQKNSKELLILLKE